MPHGYKSFRSVFRNPTKWILNLAWGWFIPNMAFISDRQLERQEISDCHFSVYAISQQQN